MIYSILIPVQRIILLGILYCSIALLGTAAIAANAPATPSPVQSAPTKAVAPATQPVLSPALRAKIDQIEKQHREAVQKLQPQLAARRAALDALLSDAKASESAIRAALTQYMATQTEIYLADIHAQRAKAAVYRLAAQLPVTLTAPTPPCGCGGGGGCGSGCGCGCCK